MSKELIESIVSNNMLEANDMVEAKLAEIRERKMYEMKRMYAARMDEIFGALTKQDIRKRREAGYKKASEILGDPREQERKSPRINPDAKILKKKVSEETLDEDAMSGAANIMNTLRSRGIRGNISRSILKKLRGKKTDYSPLKQAEKAKKKEEPVEAEPEKEKPVSKIKTAGKAAISGVLDQLADIGTGNLR